MSIIKCPECQRPVSSMAGTCPHCGARIADNLVKCDHCGNFCTKDLDTCPTCGNPLKKPVQTKPETSAPIPQKRKKSRGCLWRFVLLLVVAAILGGGGYLWYLQMEEKREARDLQMLSGAMNPDFYEQFLQDHPNSPHVADVRRRMEQLLAEADEWQDVLRSKKRIDLLRFQQAHPNSLHSRECRDMIDSIDWLDARNIGTVEAMQDYMANHPDGLYTSEASDTLNAIIKSRITPEEKSLIRGVLNTFFTRGLAKQDSLCIAECIADSMARFCNTRNATPNQILSFAKEKMAEDVIGIHYIIDSGMNVRRETLSDGKLGIAADFSLEETVNRTDASRPTFHTYHVTTLLNSERKIVLMNIK